VDAGESTGGTVTSTLVAIGAGLRLVVPGE
jgi:hypothetical protein